MPHRKRVKTFNEPGHAHFWTCSCFHRLPLLTNDLWRTWLSRHLDDALALHRFQLMAYVFMPEHFHLILLPMDAKYSMAVVKKAIKRPFSGQVKEHLLTVQSPLLSRLTVQERPGKMAFRFWQEGPGYDRNLYKPETILKTIDYIHGNPVRRGLVDTLDQWRWSSWRHYNDPNGPHDTALPKVHGMPEGW